MRKVRKEEYLATSETYYTIEGSPPEEDGAVRELIMDFCGYEHCQPGHSYGPNARRNYVVHFVCEGKGFLLYRGRSYQVEKGQIFILFPEESATYRADTEDPWHYCWIGYHGSVAQELTEQIGFREDRPVMMFDKTEEAARLVERMLEVPETHLENRIARTAAFLELMALLIRETEGVPGKEQEQGRRLQVMSYSEYAVHYIQNHFRDKVRIADLAGRIGISRSYLVKLVREETGMSPQEYLIDVRLRRAARLLKRSEDPVRMIAVECGYEDALTFSKSFKQKYGISPSQYRRENHPHHWKKDTEQHRQDNSPETEDPGSLND